MTPLEILKKIEEKAEELGIPEFGILSFKKAPFIEKYKKIISEKPLDDVSYLKKIEERENPEKIFPNLKSIIGFIFPYPFDKFEAFKIKYKIAQFAFGIDYHKKIRKKLKIISKEIPGKTKVLCDTSPFLEKPYGVSLGLGFMGKNTLLINDIFGSAFSLGFILTDIELPEKIKDVKKSCGNCKKCIEVCPTGAIEEDYILNPLKCISYLTIEAKNIPLEPKERWGYIYGCDLCQAVCPYNSNLKIYLKEKILDRKIISKERLRKNVEIAKNEEIDFYIKQNGKYFPLNKNLKKIFFEIIREKKEKIYFDGRNFKNLLLEQNNKLKEFFSKIQFIEKNKEFEIFINKKMLY